MLVSTSLLPTDFISSLPPNKIASNSPFTTMMFYPCGANQFVLFNYLEYPTTDDTNNLNATLTSCSLSTSIRDTWGMRAARMLTF
jgi:hypothetical protein